MTTSPREVVSALRHSHHDLAGFAAGSGPADLTAASCCPDWTRAQVLSHLGSTAEIALANLEAARAGGEPFPTDRYAPVWARWDGLDPAGQAAGFVQADGAYVTALETLDDATLAGLGIKVPWQAAPQPLLSVVLARLAEHALHRWDILASIDPAAPLAEDAAEILVTNPLGLQGVRPEVLGREIGSEPARIAISTTWPGYQFLLEIGDHSRLLPGGPRAEGVDGSLTLPAEALPRLLTGRMDRAHTPAELVYESTTIALDELRAVFPGY